LDKPNADSDRRLAFHLVSLYETNHDDISTSNTLPTRSTPIDYTTCASISQEFLKEYLLYCRNHIFPDISNDAEKLLIKNYLELRSLGGSYFFYIILCYLLCNVHSKIYIKIIHKIMFKLHKKYTFS
jgi:DNA replicative helicase MCM subunit Mcm2 (Cdc46/Mcm family)